jgi:hypothetical protein
MIFQTGDFRVEIIHIERNKADSFSGSISVENELTWWVELADCLCYISPHPSKLMVQPAF